MRVLLLSTLMALVGAGLTAKAPVNEADVIAPIGKIRGNFMRSRLGRRFFAARGVRYAEPPVGENRFQPPIPARPWTTVFDATQEGPSCPQPGGTLPSEDCLRLNVYSPELPCAEKPDVKKPVVVFFHTGGFFVGSAQSISFGPEYLMDQDIVLVTVNYRLGPLGFISTGDSLAPGNFGLKDQVEALRWVQKNIEAFGGDSKKVTISGQSAGAWCVSLHMVSPMSRGLFHRAIAMSGAATDHKGLSRNETYLVERQAALLGCPTDTTQIMINCLKTKTAQEISDSVINMFEWNGNPIPLWSPVVEPEVPGVERFLPAQPEDLIRQGKFHQVPLMTGITEDEFGGVVIDYLEDGNSSWYDALNTRWEELAPIMAHYERGTPRSKEISRDLRSLYFKDQPVSPDTIHGIAQMYTDGLGFTVHRLATLISAYSSQPVYYYEFAYQGRYSHRVWNATGRPYGVQHIDDLLYLFYLKSNFPEFKVGDPEYRTVKRMTSIWNSFAKTGNPIPAGERILENVTWEAFTPRNKKYLRIDDTPTMKTGLHTHRMNEWERLFRLRPVTAITNVKQ